jgi:prolyl-tRNA synthetase
VPADAEVVSHQLLLRGGFMRQLSAGIYSFLPLGYRVVRKVEQIVREEMDAAGALEVLLPAVQPASLWEQSGRWDKYGPELLRFKDRKGNAYCLGPTHEEVIVDLVRDEVRSYKQLPLNLYQIQTKFRDEIRPRAGLMRGREFIMKDAYSFDVDEAAALRSYKIMFEAYKRIFTRCGLEFRPVEAATGNIGGSASHEFQVLADSGEDAITSCPACHYTANAELAEIGPSGIRDAEAALAALERVDTPGQRTVDEVTAFLDVSPRQLAKTLIYLADGVPVAVMVRGDTEANELKIQQVLGAETLEMAPDAEVQQLTGAPVGFAGPIGLDLPIYADWLVQAGGDLVVGANEADAHYRGANWGRDFEASFHDLTVASAGRPCGRCGATFKAYRGIEVGHVFLLGTAYSQPMGATFLDDEGQSRPFVMGCYGIGITRIVSAAIEQNHDDHGVIWPMPLAPVQVVILALQIRDSQVVETAQRLHDELTAAGVEVLLDDRDERPGFKFKDADLIGVPLRITVGTRGLKEGKVELKHRADKDYELVATDEIVRLVQERIARAMAG